MKNKIIQTGICYNSSINLTRHATLNSMHENTLGLSIEIILCITLVKLYKEIITLF